MGHVLCLLFEHKKAGVVFSSSRFYCSRCGIDLGVTGEFRPAQQTPVMPKTTVSKVTKRRLTR